MQVHVAYLSDAGAALTGLPAGSRCVAKVRHPNIEFAMERDFAFMMGVASLANMVPALEHLRLEDTMAQFAGPLREQVRGGMGSNQLCCTSQLITLHLARFTSVH